MRYDFKTDRLCFTRDRERQKAFVRADRLAYARFETALAQKFFAIVDLVFAEGDEIAVLPFIVVDGTMLLERELSPFIWPAHLKDLDDGVVEAIEARIEPWLRSLIVARNENGFGERLFSEDVTFKQRLERAKQRGWLGTAPAREVLLDIAPHAYAVRFAFSGDVVVRGRGALNGAAYLSVGNGRTLAVAANEEEAVDARAWFGLDKVEVDAPGRCDLYVGPRVNAPDCGTAIFLESQAEPGERRVSVAAPLPIEVLLSYDLDDAGEASSFAVRARPRSARASHVTVPAATGGSAGRVALVAREDLLRVRDADTDAVTMLQTMLTAEGFSAEIVAPSHFRVDGFDLIHVFGFRYAPAIAAQIHAARDAGTPVVLTAYADDPQNDYPIGTGTFRRLLQNTDDEIVRGEYLHALSLRRLRDDELVDALDVASVKLLCSTARVAYVTCAREEQRLRADFGFDGTSIHVPAIAFNTNGDGDPTWATGYDDFALVFGPVGTESNAYLIARAASRLGIPLIVCGDVVDAAYYPELRTVLGRQGIWLPARELSEGERRSLLARARVVLDVSWSGQGLHRLASAACAGVPIVGSSTGYAGDVWGDLAFVADPASEESIAVALGRAWLVGEEHRRGLVMRTAPLADPLSVLVNTVQGYQEAARSFTRL